MGRPESVPPGEELPAIQEGSTRIYFPPSVSLTEIFYNPTQTFNRDLTCLVISAFRSRCDSALNILEAFAASGLRSIRYAQEIPNVHSVIANDSDPQAISVIDRNIELNHVSRIVRSSLCDAALLLANHRKSFQVIDVDPYGTSAAFLEASVQSVCDGGLLCVNSTDGRSLCGTRADSAYSSYQSIPLRTEFSHEFGIRVLLTALIGAAARCGRSVEPLLSLSISFYFRVFVTVRDRRGDSKVTAASTSLCFYSQDSQAFWLQPIGVCQQQGTARTIRPASLQIPHSTDPWTNGPLLIGGPVYTGKLHDTEFCRQLFDVLPSMQFVSTADRIKATLSTCLAELESPFYYNFDALCSLVKCQCPSRVMLRSALKRAGFESSLTHCRPGMIKTNAPPEAIWDLVRTCYWAEKQTAPVNEKARQLVTAERTIEFTLEIDNEVKEKLLEEKRQCRFLQNPTKDYGPRAAAKPKPKRQKETKTDHQ
jgi:tRNA (guanine26-N2/guanine27-N2)-dimethyltransferase